MRNFYFLLMMVLVTGNAHAMNTMADMVRHCENVLFAGPDNYVLKCTKTEKITNVMSDEHNMPQFFVADNDGDRKGTFLSQIPTDNQYVYVNIVSNLKDPRYENQTCYRFITEKDVARDGFYAVEVCEYERPDYYL